MQHITCIIFKRNVMGIALHGSEPGYYQNFARVNDAICAKTCALMQIAKCSNCSVPCKTAAYSIIETIVLNVIHKVLLTVSHG